MEKVLQQNNRRYQQWQSQIHSNHQKTQVSEAAMQDTLIFIENKLTGLHTRWSTAGDFQAQRRSLEFSQDQTDALTGQKTLQHWNHFNHFNQNPQMTLNIQEKNS